MVWTEEGNKADLTDDGGSGIQDKELNDARTLNNRIFTYTSDSNTRNGPAMAITTGMAW